MSVTPKNLMRMLRIQLKAAPKQAVVLGGLVVVLLFVVVRMIIGLGPDSVEAMPPSSPVALLPTVTANGAVAVTAQLLPNVRPQLPELRKHATRDIFAISWLTDTFHSSQKPVTAGTSNLVVDDESLFDLVLELTLTGATDSRQHYAVINGTRVRVGESIRGFVVDTIAPGRVVLLDGYNERIIVQMK